MADFGTILNPQNFSQSIYCKNIQCVNIDTFGLNVFGLIDYKIPYAFGTLTENLQITQQQNYPAELVDSSNTIMFDFSQSPVIKPLIKGVYEFTIVCQGSITDLSVPTTRGTTISTYANVYDASDNILFTSKYMGATCYLNDVNNISNTFQARFKTGDYIVFVIAPTSATIPFTFIINNYSVSMKYISS